MKCKFCETDNPKEAVFCENCGKRLDGKKPCPSCNTLNNQNANYCISCGKNLSGRVFCQKCGTPYIGNACPNCGKQVAPSAERVAVVPKSDGKSTMQKVFDILSGAFAMAGVFFAFLFMFFIGIKASAGMSSIGLSVSSDTNIFYYFKEAYTNVSEALELLEGYSGEFQFFSYVSAIFGTLISAATLITVTTFAIIAVVKYLLKVLKKSDKDYSKFAIAAVLAYLCGCVAFIALHAVNLKIKNEYSSINARTLMSPATIAGVTLSLIFLFAFLVCKILSDLKHFKQKKLVPFILSGVGIAVCGLLLIFVKDPVGTLKNDLDSYKISLGSGFAMMADLFLLGTSATNVFASDQLIGNVFAMVGQLALFALIVLIIGAMANFMKNVIKNKQESGLAYAIVIEVFAVANLVFAVITTQKYTSFIEEFTDMAFAAPIVTLVFSSMLLALTIVHKVFNSAKPHTETPVSLGVADTQTESQPQE